MEKKNNKNKSGGQSAALQMGAGEIFRKQMIASRSKKQKQKREQIAALEMGRSIRLRIRAFSRRRRIDFLLRVIQDVKHFTEVRSEALGKRRD